MSQLAIMPGQQGVAAAGSRGAAAAAGQSGDGFASALGKARKAADGSPETRAGKAEERDAASKGDRSADGGETAGDAKVKGRGEGQSVRATASAVDPKIGAKTSTEDVDSTGDKAGTRDGDEAAGAEGEAGKAGEEGAGGSPVATVMAVMSLLNAKTVGPQEAQGARGAGAAPQRGGGRIDGEAMLSVRTGALEADKAMAQTVLGGAQKDVGAAIEAAFGGRPEGGSPDNAFDKGKAAAMQESVVRFEGQPGQGAKPAAGLAAPAPIPADGARPQPIVVPVDLGRALAGEGDLPASMREAVSSHVARVMATPVQGQPMSVLRIQLQPAHLGQVNVTMRLSGEQVHVTLTPDSASAARVLGSDQDAIAGVLRSLGGAFAGASVEVGGDMQARQPGDGGAARDGSAAQGEAFRDEGGRQRPGSGAMTHGEPTDAGGPPRGGAQTSSGDGRIII
ncbi:flagellar hook-length control protein FliK [Roseitalea porphyridii]|uniref:Flagellar hook-length control protein FliK n=1 Tax=Roseitalea porphyridii TaxID=1852022 RepID=A0A4V1A3W1_9HYPH|nr:flagellar hook-length control protein FliK [Roseitalea porphyridii]QBK30498.1 flagellar hook-length control protein FliK [Roseitalea porphyridii]